MTEQPWADADALAAWQAGDPTTVLTAAEAAVRDYCGWHVAPSRTEDIVVDGSGASIQPLPTLYLTAVNSLSEVDASTGSDVTTVRTVDVDFQWSEAGYLTRSTMLWPGVWTCRVRGILANITHGYDDVPPELTAVVLSAASRAVSSQGALRQVGQVAWATGQDGQPVGIQLSAAEKYALDRYRIARIA